MIKKIISGGQAGAEQAALDAAIKCNIPHGGWALMGRKHESGILPPGYNLKEIKSTNYSILIEKNVKDSDATLIVSNGNLTGESGFTRDVTFKHKRPCLHVDLMEIDQAAAALKISDWISEHHIERLNISGSRASNDPRIYQSVLDLMQKLFLVECIDVGFLVDRLSMHSLRDPDEVVDLLIHELPLKVKVSIANIPEQHLDYFCLKTKKNINILQEKWAGYKELQAPGRNRSCQNDADDENAGFITRKLWNRLRDSHSLKVIK